MAKTTDVPHELRDFNRLFSNLEHGWNYDRFYADFIDFLTESFMPERQGVYEDLKKRYKSLDGFVKLTHEFIRTQDRQIVEDGMNGWFDALGGFYEILTSRGKSQWLGQFFTPKEVCTMMAMMAGATSDNTSKGLTVHDPASGSGRMLLAWHAIAPGNYQFGADLDPICAKMTAINMCIHGCEGEAVCMDSLKLEWRFGYRINRRIRATGQPTIEPIEREQSRIMAHWIEEEERIKNEPKKPEMSRKGQFLLF